MLWYLSTAVLTLWLLWLSWIDLQSFRLPDRGTLPLVALGLGLSALAGREALLLSLAGGAIGYGLFALIGHLHFRRRGEEGLGLGDAKLFAASGTWLGLPMLPYVLLIAALGGLAWALIARAQGRLAFGPWIALGFWCVWLARGPGSWG